MRCCAVETVDQGRLIRKQARAEERERRRRRYEEPQVLPSVDLRDWCVNVPAYGRLTEDLHRPVSHLTASGAWNLNDAVGSDNLLLVAAMVAGLRGPPSLGHVAAHLWSFYACPPEEPRFLFMPDNTLCSHC